MKPKNQFFALLAFAGLVGMSSGFLLSRGVADTAPAPVFPKELTSYRDVVKRALPAVVSIRVTAAKTTQVRGEPRMRLPEGFNLPEGIREQLEEQMERQGEGGAVRPGAFGSGVIIDPKGVVVTNNHVVAGAKAVLVTLQDGRRFESKSIATDPKTDLAVVKLEAKGLPYLEFGDSDAMEIGDRVLAVGAPFGLEGSVSCGIVSGKGRSAGMMLYEDYIQTDAAINPGNSGGPLVSLEGRVIGICNSIRTSTGGSQGVGMAIPARIAKDVARQLAQHGAVTRGYLGIRYGDAPAEVAARLGIEAGKGAVVGQVMPNTPASKAGLLEGDVIVALDGKPLASSKDIQRQIAQTEIGQEVKFGILRDGKKETVTVKIEAQPAEYGLRDVPVRMGPGGAGRRQQQRNPGDAAEPLKIEKLGLEAMELTADQKERLGYAKAAAGALIWNVDRNSPAANAGLRRGMIIAKADGQPVASPEELEKAVEKGSLQKGILLFVKTPQGSEYVMLKQDEE